MSGKGDRPRSTDKKVFDKNFDDIDWSDGKAIIFDTSIKGQGQCTKRIEPRSKIGRR